MILRNVQNRPRRTIFEPGVSIQTQLKYYDRAPFTAWYLYFQPSWGKIQETGTPQGFPNDSGF